MTTDQNTAHLRTLRRKSGLSQKELAHILGFRSGAPISRHERSDTVPDLLTALGYDLGDHPKAATCDQFKTGHSEGLRHTH